MVEIFNTETIEASIGHKEAEQGSEEDISMVRIEDIKEEQRKEGLVTLRVTGKKHGVISVKAYITSREIALKRFIIRRKRKKIMMKMPMT